MAEENARGKLKVDYATAVSRFASAMQKFPVKKILYRNIFRGRGLEFDSYRDFAPDDDANLIDWMASLRAKKLVARKYIEERDLHVYFVLDVSNSMLFGSGSKLKSEYAAEFILAMSYLIMESGDKVGLFLVNNKIVRYIEPSSGKKQFFKLVRALSDEKNYGGAFSLDGPIEEALHKVNSMYTVFILVSDFIKLHSTTEKNLSYLTAKYETLAVMLRDPFDEELPNTYFQFSVSDPYSDRQVLLDPSVAADDYRMIVQRHNKRIKQMFVRTNIDLIELNIREEFYMPVSSFLRQRSRGERI